MQSFNLDAILAPIICKLHEKEKKTLSRKELNKKALAILLAQVAENEIDTILEISAKALEELGWSEIGEDLKQRARQIRIFYF